MAILGMEDMVRLLKSLFQNNEYIISPSRNLGFEFANDSFFLKKLSYLLKDPTVNVDEELSIGTPLINAFAEHISDSNFDILYPCIQLLVHHCANVNIPDEKGATPIHKIVDSNQLKIENKRVMVEYLLQNANATLDIDCTKNLVKQLELTESIPGLQLPQVRFYKNYDYNVLMMYLQEKREADFLRGIDIIAVYNPNQFAELISDINGYNLLINAVVMGQRKAVEKLLRLGVDVNVTFSIAAGWSERYSLLANALDYAIISEYDKVIELLLRSPKLICRKDLVVSFVKNIARIVCNHDAYKYKNCFHLLVDHRNNDKYDLNWEDSEGLTALHYAIKYNNSTFVDALLEKGAYIGIKNIWGCSISNVNSEVLEEHFNRCITSDYSRHKANPELAFNYKNLVPSKSMRETSEKPLYEMTAIELLSQAKELKHLISHPLIMSFFCFKWKRLMLFFYINLFLCALYAVASVLYIIFCFIDDATGCVSIKILTMLLLSYNVVREIIQVILSPRIYLTSMDNYLECASTVLMIIITCDLAADSWRRTVAATTIILIACEIFVLVGTIPLRSVAVHFVMLETVAKNFLKCLSLYSIIIIAFALSFYALFHDPLLHSSKNSTTPSAFSSNESQTEWDNGYNTFGSIGSSLLKTLVMTIGELDAGSIDFNGKVTSYIIFVIFILSVTTVLANLLNGLAVSDIGAVRSEAELLYLIRRCQVLARCEKLFLSTRFTKQFWNKYPISLFTVFDLQSERSMETQNYKAKTDGGLCQEFIDGALGKRKVEETQHFSEKTDREIIDRAFNMIARRKIENDDGIEKNLFERSLGEVNEQLKLIVTDKNQLNERMTKIESTLKVISENLSELMKK